MVAHQRIEQEGIHVVADPEGEQADVARRACRHVLDDRLCFSLAFRRQPVRHEQHGRLPFAVRHVERCRQRAVDARPAFGVHSVNPVNRFLRGAGRCKVAAERAPARAEQDHVETVAFVQVVEDVSGGFARLVPFVAVHAAGLIQHHNQVTRHNRVGAGDQRRLHQQREEAILVGAFAVSQQVDVDRVAGDAVVQAEPLGT